MRGSESMANKGSKRVANMGTFKHITYHCNRCGVDVAESNWNHDSHKGCDRNFKKKWMVDKAQ